MGFADRSDRERALVQIGRVIDRLVREGTAVARSDGSVHTLFPVAVSAAEAEALQGWIIREGAVHTIEVGLGYAISALFVCAGLCTNDRRPVQPVSHERSGILAQAATRASACWRGHHGPVPLTERSSVDDFVICRRREERRER